MTRTSHSPLGDQELLSTFLKLALRASLGYLNTSSISLQRLAGNDRPTQNLGKSERFLLSVNLLATKADFMVDEVAPSLQRPAVVAS